MGRELTIAGRRISDDDPCYVIAEIGGNHGGDEAVAAAMVREAARCGVDAAKFQKRENDTLYVRSCLEAPYANENSFGDTYHAHRAALELTPRCLAALDAEGRRAGITVFATAFDERSADHCADLGFPAIKIHSGGLTDRPLLTHVARLRLPVLLSTGGGTIADIDRAVEAKKPISSAF
jgi:sialic acid synthase